MFILLLCGLVSAHEWSTKVLQWSETTYTEHRQKELMIMFYAPWCPHCVRLMPTWEQLALKFPFVAAVDCEQDSLMRHRFGIKGFPSLVYLPANSDVAYKFKGNRTLDDLSAFIQGGWEKQGEILPINENVDSWSLMLAELNSPIVLIATGVMAFFVMLILLMCWMDRRDAKKVDVPNNKMD